MLQMTLVVQALQSAASQDHMDTTRLIIVDHDARGSSFIHLVGIMQLTIKHMVQMS